jgi:hypothetical protein
MTGLLTEVGKRVATRWFLGVLLPGLLLVAVAYCAAVLGHRHALDIDALNGAAERTADSGRSRPARLVVEIALALGLAGLLGVAARGTGRLVQRFWLRERHLLPGSARSRWSRQSRELAAAKRRGIDPVRAYLPRRPTWMGDRVRLIEARVRAQYRFSATLVWPRIWLLTPDQVHAPIGNARTRFDDACVLAGWATLYVLVGVCWWPAALAGLVTALTAVRRARVALDEFGTLVESAIDLHWRALAAALGITIAGQEISEAEAALIEDRLHKGG